MAPLAVYHFRHASERDRSLRVTDSFFIFTSYFLRKQLLTLQECIPNKARARVHRRGVQKCRLKRPRRLDARASHHVGDD